MDKSKTITIWTDGTWKIWQSRDAELAANDDNWFLNILCSELDLIKELQTEVDELALENAAQQQVLGENTSKRVFRYGHRGDVMVHSCDKHPRLGFTPICCGCLTDYNEAVTENTYMKRLINDYGNKDFDFEVLGLIDRLEAQLEKHRWIPVEEGLPEEDADCLTFDSKFVGMGCYQKNSDTLRMQWQVNGYVSKTVTHWRYVILPEGE